MDNTDGEHFLSADELYNAAKNKEELIPDEEIIDKRGGVLSATTTGQIDPAEGLIMTMKLIWIEEVNSRQTELSFKEWVIGKVGE